MVSESRDVQRRPTPYPLFIRLEGERVVVVGAGSVAARKVDTLLEYGADVTVVSPVLGGRIREHAEQGVVRWIERGYVAGDLAGARLAIVATSDAEVNRRACEEATANGVLVNVTDAPELCTCLVPSIVRRGQLQIAVSTNGAAPSVARELARDLDQRFAPWWEDYIDVLADVRALIKRRVPGSAARRAPLFEALREARLDERLAAGERLDAQRVYEQVVVPLLEGSDVA